jgi:hypothetical protein
VPAADLAGDFRCGPFDTKELEATEHNLLGDRVRFRFFANANAVGSGESGKLEAQRDGVTVFFGAREMYLLGDAQFERRAAKTAAFGGTYDPVTLTGRDGKLAIVTGLVQKPKPDQEMIAVAHGWFLDPNRDVVDVAFFVSRSALGELQGCRRFAEKIFGTITQGKRQLQYGSTGDVEKIVSYAKFVYRLPPSWMLTDAMGIHDFARLHFRKRGTFPKGFTELQMALDSHPGDWAAAGEAEGERAGKLLGLSVSWHLTRDATPPPTLGAWTVSKDVVRNDHAVASLQATSAEDREEAIKLAESVRVAGR